MKTSRDKNWQARRDRVKAKEAENIRARQAWVFATYGVIWEGGGRDYYHVKRRTLASSNKFKPEHMGKNRRYYFISPFSPEKIRVDF